MRLVYATTHNLPPNNDILMCTKCNFETRIFTIIPFGPPVKKNPGYATLKGCSSPSFLAHDMILTSISMPGIIML